MDAAVRCYKRHQCGIWWVCLWSAICDGWPERLRGPWASSAGSPGARPQPAARFRGSEEGRERSREPPLDLLAQHHSKPAPLSDSGRFSGSGGTPFPSAPRVPAAKAGPGRWRRPCRPWLLCAVCCGLRRSAPAACYRRRPPPCGEVSTADVPEPRPALRPSLRPFLRPFLPAAMRRRASDRLQRHRVGRIPWSDRGSWCVPSRRAAGLLSFGGVRAEGSGTARAVSDRAGPRTDPATLT